MAEGKADADAFVEAVTNANMNEATGMTVLKYQVMNFSEDYTGMEDDEDEDEDEDEEDDDDEDCPHGC